MTDTSIAFNETLSPYAHVLHTNHVPSDSELYEIKAFLSKPEFELDRLEAEVTRAQAILDGLVSKRDKLKHFVDAHKALISPVRRLPPEILQEIFVRCLSTTRNSVMHNSEPPMLLTEVCSDWRRIALATPALWSSLHLVLSNTNSSEKSPPKQFAAAKAWLKRSGSFLLSVSLYDASWDYSLSRFIEFLDPVIHRCRTLEFVAPMQLVARLDTRALPFLEEIAIHSLNLFTGYQGDNGLSFLKEATSLRRVTMTGRLQFWPAPFPLANLETLYLHSDSMQSFTPTQAFEILTQCRNLRVFSLSVPEATFGEIVHREAITLPLLHSFYILASDNLLQSILGSLILPEIQALGISRVFDSLLGFDFEHHSLLESILARSSRALKKFVFRPLLISQLDLFACLSLMPEVADLHIYAVRFGPDFIDDAFLHMLLPSFTHTCLCPNLKKIILDRCSVLSGDALTDFIRSRWRPAFPGIGRLLHASITFDVYPEFPMAESQIKAFRDEGLDISVSFPPKVVLEPRESGLWDGLDRDLGVPWSDILRNLDTEIQLP